MEYINNAQHFFSWKIINGRARELLRDTAFKNSSGCRDCEEYGLLYNNANKTDNGVKYKPFHKFLREQFLNKQTEK
jgi:hypothetical protein